MRHSPLIYAQALKQALAEVSASQQDSVLKNFKAVLVKNGDQFLGDKVVVFLEEILTREALGKVVTIETARPLSSLELEPLRERFSASDLIRFKISPLLIAGVRITVGEDRELDLSMARKLKQIFSN